MKEQAQLPAVTFQKINKTRLSDQIMNQIKEMIAGGILQQGQQLPSERELSTILNVSRLPLREALKALEATHVISAEYGGSYFVCNLYTASLVQFFKDANEESNDHLLQDLKEARRIVESAAVELACKRMTATDLRAMKDAIARMGEVLKENNTEAIVSASLDFHRQMIAASHNLLLVKMMDCISTTLHEGRLRTMDTSRERYYNSMTEHTKIVDAIESGNVKLAKQLLKNHLNPVY